jgi:hypothetical protein
VALKGKNHCGSFRKVGAQAHSHGKKKDFSAFRRIIYSNVLAEGRSVAQLTVPERQKLPEPAIFAGAGM